MDSRELKLWLIEETRGLRGEIGSHSNAIAPSAELFDVPLEQSFGAIRAEAVRKVSFRVLVDVSFQLRPIALVIPDLLAARTDGEQATQDLDPIDRLL